MGQNTVADYTEMYQTEESHDSFLALYQTKISSGQIIEDSSQMNTVQALDRLGQQLFTLDKQNNFLSYIGFKKRPVVKGLYIWGGVGRGKTYLMNLFYRWLPTDKKMRLHFHRFMEIVHEKLAEYKQERNPLSLVSEYFSSKTTLLCLDEMMVNDIVDAMILGGLFEALYKNNVVVVMTSNQMPNDLYKDGLQRQRFLPAIDMINANSEVVELTGVDDHRKRILNAQISARQWDFTLLDDHYLNTVFDELTQINLHEGREDILINGRMIPVIKWADSLVWFNFDMICRTDRSTDDYAEISLYFKTVMISDVPILTEQDDDAARRFITLIDTLYDSRNTVILSIETEPEALYQGVRLKEAFKRTSSRLTEMQSTQYSSQKEIANGLE